jgi:hypothetical protein
MENKMRKRFKLPLLLIILLIVLIIGVLVFKLINKSSNNNNSEVKVLDSINDYTLDERDSKLMKETYQELKEILNAKEINYEDYAITLAKLFVIDLFTMNNKINKYDVGSTEYVYPDALSNFKLNVEDTLYKKIENNTDGKRNQELPVVKKITSSEIKECNYTINDVTYDAFTVSLTWDYDVDLDYDNAATITLIQKNDKVYVVEYSAKGE